MIDFDPERFAAEWIGAWNRLALEEIVSHYTDDVRFVSPRAAATVGSAVVTGKRALRDYWARRIEQISRLDFVLDRLIWDGRTRELAIVYTSNVNGAATRACELFLFDAGGRVVEGEAMYGATGEPSTSAREPQSGTS